MALPTGRSEVYLLFETAWFLLAPYFADSEEAHVWTLDSFRGDSIPLDALCPWTAAWHTAQCTGFWQSTRA